MKIKKATIVKNAIIYTLDQSNSIFESMLIIDGFIEKLGTIEEIDEFWRDYYKKNNSLKFNVELNEIDLQKKFVYPGFIDAHLHPITCIVNNTCFNCENLRSFEEFAQGLKNFARKLFTINTPVSSGENQKYSSDQWIVAIKFNEQNFTDPNQRILPNRWNLDDVISSHPIVVYRYDLHIVCLNSRALEILGIDNSPYSLDSRHKIQYGEIRVDKNGIPNGLLTEDAMKLLDPMIPIPTKSELIDAMNRFSFELGSHGITAIGAVVSEQYLPILEKLDFFKSFPQDVAFYFNVKEISNVISLRKKIQVISSKKDHISVNGLKRFMDGSFGAKTAWLYQPYNNLGETDTKTNDTFLSGMCATNLEQLARDLKEASKQELDVMVHAIGDRANKELVALISNHWKKFNLKSNKHNFPRIRIEHASMLSIEVIREMAKLNIIPVSQPEFIRSESSWLIDYIGDERIKITYPFRDLIKHGLPLAGASDAPVESLSVLRALQDCILRFGLNPSQSISIQDALKLYTQNAAYAIHQEHIRGTLEKGKIADFIVFKDDLLKINPKEIDKIKIYQTYHRGICIFDNNIKRA
ncbi:MAG: amidohydrolase [Candidatus Lokiarchaeota archaeon]|nr:amidohydrolase [Candidatus Harpocratesius repetitus]